MLHQLIAITVFLSISITPNLAQPHLCGAYTDTQFLPDDCTSIPQGTGNGEATDAPCCNPPNPGENCISCPTPAPTTPAPTTPAPTTPAPTTPAPTTPAPVTPAPTTTTTTTITTTTCVCPTGYGSSSSGSGSSSDSGSSSSGAMGTTLFDSMGTTYGSMGTTLDSSDSDSYSDSSSDSYSDSSSDSYDEPCICTTSFITTLDYDDSSSDSGSISGSDSDSSDAVAAHVAANVREDLDEIEANTDDEAQYTMKINFSDFTLMNIWGLFGVLMIANMLCCWLCQRNRNQTQKAHLEQDEDGGSRLDVLA